MSMDRSAAKIIKVKGTISTFEIVDGTDFGKFWGRLERGVSPGSSPTTQMQ